MDLRFRKHEHLRSKADFDRLFARRCSVSDNWLVVFGGRNEFAYSRLGCAVKKRIGNSPFRNRLRRLYREAFRLTRSELPTGLDLVLLPRDAREPQLEVLRDSLRKLLPSLERKLARLERPA